MCPLLTPLNSKNGTIESFDMVETKCYFRYEWLNSYIPLMWTMNKIFLALTNQLILIHITDKIIFPINNLQPALHFHLLNQGYSRIRNWFRSMKRQQWGVKGVLILSLDDPVIGDDFKDQIQCIIMTWIIWPWWGIYTQRVATDYQVVAKLFQGDFIYLMTVPNLVVRLELEIL